MARMLTAMGIVALMIAGLYVVGPAREQSATTAAAPQEYRTYGKGSSHVVEVELDAVETVQEVAAGERYHVWTFGGTLPGPVIRVRQGDTVRFTLTNDSELGLSHSIDFHAAQTPCDVNYQPVPPGETLSFDWVARFPGVFMYHCGVPPVLHHISNGMYGAVIVEPREALPPAREYVLVASELYPGRSPNAGVFEGDVARMEEADPGYVLFNGVADQYLDAPLVARPNELIRLWVMNAGPTLTNAFHVIGALFDHVYPDGNPTSPMNGIQTWNVPPGGGAMFELRVPDEGLYPFVTHSFAYTGLGSVGVIKVDGSVPPAPAEYPAMGLSLRRRADRGLRHRGGLGGGSCLVRAVRRKGTGHGEGHPDLRGDLRVRAGDARRRGGHGQYPDDESGTHGPRLHDR